MLLRILFIVIASVNIAVVQLKKTKWTKQENDDLPVQRLAVVALQRCSLTPLTVLLMETLENDRYGS